MGILCLFFNIISATSSQNWRLIQTLFWFLKTSSIASVSSKLGPSEKMHFCRSLSSTVAVVSVFSNCNFLYPAPAFSVFFYWIISKVKNHFCKPFTACCWERFSSLQVSLLLVLWMFLTLDHLQQLDMWVKHLVNQFFRALDHQSPQSSFFHLVHRQTSIRIVMRNRGIKLQ